MTGPIHAFVRTATRRTILALGAVATVALATPAAADPVAELYRGRTLTILLGFPPGGSYDLYAQLAAAHLGRHLPGQPAVIVRHMPGGGARKAAAHFLSDVEPDDMTIALLPDTLAHVQLLTPDRARWDASEVRYIGRFAPANVAFAVRRRAPATTVEAMRTTEIVAACTGKFSRAAQMVAMLKNLAGLQLRMVCGYKGSKATTLAALRGEVDLLSKNWASFRSRDAAALASGDLKVVFQAGLERDPELPDVPLLQELVEDPQAQRVMRFVSSGAPIGRSLMARPATPEPVVEALRAAFDRMVADPAFLADAAKRKALVAPATGAAVEAVNREIFAAPPDLVRAAREAIDTSAAGEGKP